MSTVENSGNKRKTVTGTAFSRESKFPAPTR
ncbi:hypothetical protein CCACVL1_00382 [Corchorus capsularis]|uniref:Uncharacterized protein n=1 Tax=Corchorus capsularis TaxID=210143 RepID=A0A1R3KX61_COCAP|nr:hypothetical protein CCACVL1_00382 [Corchorus capsularis]